MKSLKTIFLTILAVFCLVVVQGQAKMGQGVIPIKFQDAR
jgi:hypothetical protein